MSAFSDLAARLKKPRPTLLDKQDKDSAVDAKDRIERKKCKARSGGRCEVIERIPGWPNPNAWIPRRCWRRSSQNHHLIGGSGRRNKGKSILAEHRLETCDRCHDEITNHVLVPVDGTLKEDAATVKYERVK